MVSDAERPESCGRGLRGAGSSEAVQRVGQVPWGGGPRDPVQRVGLGARGGSSEALQRVGQAPGLGPILNLTPSVSGTPLVHTP